MPKILYILLFLCSLTSAFSARNANVQSAEFAGETLRADSLLKQYLLDNGLIAYDVEQIRIFTNGTEKFEAMFEDFRHAKRSIDIEYFIFADDSIAHLTLDVLREAAARGVKVRLIIDGYKDHERGYNYDGERLDSLRKDGIETFIFDPWRIPYLAHVPRDHKKIVVIDDEISYIGGLNVADYYINGKPEIYGGWRDTHLRIKGEASRGMSALFQKSLLMIETGIYKGELPQNFSGVNHVNLQSEKKDVRVDRVNLQSEEKDVRVDHVNLQSEEKKVRVDRVNLQSEEKDVRVNHVNLQSEKKDVKADRVNLQTEIFYFERSRENRQKKRETREALIAAFNAAQDTLRIVSPYLLPTHTVRKALIAAIDRGVHVEVLFSKVGDMPILSVGNYHFAKRMLRHGAEVFLYNGAFHHSKIMMVDGQFAMVGSANLNSRSLKWDYEASCFVFDEKTTDELNRIFKEDKLNCDTLTREYYRKIPLRERLYGWFVDRFLTPFL